MNCFIQNLKSIIVKIAKILFNLYRISYAFQIIRKKSIEKLKIDIILEIVGYIHMCIEKL